MALIDSDCDSISRGAARKAARPAEAGRKTRCRASANAFSSAACNHLPPPFTLVLLHPGRVMRSSTCSLSPRAVPNARHVFHHRSPPLHRPLAALQPPFTAVLLARSQDIRLPGKGGCGHGCGGEQPAVTTSVQHYSVMSAALQRC